MTDDYSSIEINSKKKTSKYNNSVFASSCVICGKSWWCTSYKKNRHANKDGFIGHINAKS